MDFQAMTYEGPGTKGQLVIGAHQYVETTQNAIKTGQGYILVKPNSIGEASHGKCMSNPAVLATEVTICELGEKGTHHYIHPLKVDTSSTKPGAIPTVRFMQEEDNTVYLIAVPPKIQANLRTTISTVQSSIQKCSRNCKVRK